MVPMTNAIEITLTMSTVDELAGLESALELFTECEGERRKDACHDQPGGKPNPKEWTRQNEASLRGALALFAKIRTK